MENGRNSDLPDLSDSPLFPISLLWEKDYQLFAGDLYTSLVFLVIHNDSHVIHTL